MKTVPFSLFSSSDLYTFATRLADVVAGILADNAYVILLIAQIRGGTSDLAKALGKNLKSDFTALLFAKDKVRDDSFRGMYSYIKAFLNKKDAAKAAAAQKLVEIIEEISPSLYNLGYIAETSKLEQLFERFSTPEATQWLKTISATEWFDELKEAQSEFEAMYQSKVTTEGDINLPLAGEAKIRILDSTKALLSFVKSNSKFDAATYSPLADKIDIITTEVVTIARARETRDENAKKQAAAEIAK